MIGSIKGVILLKQAPQVLVDCNGVGYEIETPMTTFIDLPEIGSQISFFTHLQVRDDAHIIYGFKHLDERSLFRTLLKVNGVGAKLALAILSAMTVHDFERCVTTEDSDALVKIPGVGKKTAERLVIEMRDRLIDVTSTASMEPNKVKSNNAKEEAFDALLALGYKLSEVKKIMSSIKVDNEKSEDIIRKALKRVGH
ncbi:MAG: Holliday junction branch migration protein RuvA [Pseudomonadota bacterium]|nr:Holliday junction branch migration protein RuvA [Pseudomonadota bacterium]MEC8955652.1 Holliday junction branch migration protein RuvA [Pseudomonadota bacterium]